MSDTPKTDAQTHDPIEYDSMGGWSWSPYNMKPQPDGDWVPADFARELERENAELREYCQRLERDSELFRADIVPRLQEDKARLDWLLTYRGRDWLFRSIENGELIESITSDRELIDAARKEAQP